MVTPEKFSAFPTSAMEDKTVRLWDASTGDSLPTIAADSAVVSVAPFLDGTSIACVSEDKKLRVWESGTGRLQLTAVCFTDGEYVAYTPDGEYTCSKPAERHLTVVVDGETLALSEEYRKRFARPDGLTI